MEIAYELNIFFLIKKNEKNNRLNAFQILWLDQILSGQVK